MKNIKSETSNKTKIGYIKINSTNGQITFNVYEIFGGVRSEISGGPAVLFNRPNIHKENVKKNNIVHLNVKTDMFVDHAPQIKQHIRLLMKVFLDLEIEDFKLVMHEFK